MSDSNDSGTFLNRMLDKVEKVGNKLPDPAVMFFGLLIIVWVFSYLLSGIEFDAVHPLTGENVGITNLLAGDQMADFLANMVGTFMGFAPLGVVLVAMLGVGVAERSGFINVAIKLMLNVTPKMLLTPVLILVAIVSHTAVDAGYVLVIPLGGVIFYAAGRHPLAGIAAAFAGVSGGFSANFVPSAIDPLLQGFTQSAAQILDPAIQLNPLNNYFFTAASSIVVVIVGWYLTDRVIEPRLQRTARIDGDQEDMPALDDVTPRDRKAFYAGVLTMALGLVALYFAASAENTPLADASGELASFTAPLMQMIVPLIFLLFIIPGIVHGYISGSFKNSQDVIKAMSKSMEDMAYYMVMAFFCALFIKAFGDSNLGTLISIKGAQFLSSLQLSGGVTMVGIIILVAFINLFIGSASAKWALISPIFVPMLMQLGYSPDLTQAAYRVGDSISNIITPLLPYFPLVVLYCQRYVKSTGIGSLVAMMLPFTLTLLVVWSAFLIIYWMIGIPLGFQANYVYPAG
ncbi:aminobenzoyl-glutamate transporter [Pseudidiomarina tainanensis]|jgi:aminobenzoyl-glutamate transport protein|uniref:Aminobenzoyl-glutamate transporter n=2 Tax=Pseudidiomarina TaxID=2800384 RepID=A0ACD2HKM2_9GAMM|nr:MULTISPECIES: AbgT family transporter [Pseudidiomarina]RZQ57151.1 aminobenzoyl-glutamate transporter [Pseudidiomarina tainanensis]SFR37234.1 AbgT putative transporter family protein [Pseudidiomarina maritima]